EVLPGAVPLLPRRRDLRVDVAHGRPALRQAGVEQLIDGPAADDVALEAELVRDEHRVRVVRRWNDEALDVGAADERADLLLHRADRQQPLTDDGPGRRRPPVHAPPLE